ncbi:hypothetical protein [Chitinophaga sedimenti]|uniref:hypothetical protein n=1 Tax=Chitinophaga sedimenti TaxID=2033606 RepID=UPI0027E0FAEF|nr:hypothetical protein [Chitinophaga sedimenti]
MDLNADDNTKVPQTLELFHDCKVDEWAEKEKQHFMEEAFRHLEDIAVMSGRKNRYRSSQNSC